MKLKYFISCIISCLMATTGFAQMEKRAHKLYDANEFAAQYPQVGDRAPDLELTDLDGKTVRISDFVGRTVVLLKAGYT